MTHFTEIKELPDDSPQPLLCRYKLHRFKKRGTESGMFLNGAEQCRGCGLVRVRLYPSFVYVYRGRYEIPKTKKS